jgi:uncharacterized protein (TIGR02271 family)
MSTELDLATLQRVIGFKVEDSAGERVGTIHNLWSDEQGQPVLLGVKTGWIFGKNHVVPVANAELNEARQVVRLPFTEDQIKNAPSFDADAEIEDYDQDRIFTYYGVNLRPNAASGVNQHQVTEAAASTATPSLQQEHMTTPASAAPAPAASENMPVVEGEQTIRLKEEAVKVGKREVEAGGIRLRKVIRTETVNQPVELKREEIVVERVPASENVPAAQGGFKEEDVYVPLRREEPVVQKQARVTEEVHVGKKVETERTQVTEQVRKEELRVDDKRT